MSEVQEALTIPGRGHGAKLTFKDVAQILALEDSGKSQTEIAKLFGVSQGQISRIVNGFKDSREVARQRLHASAEKLVDHALTASGLAAAKGNAEPALELLDRMEVAPKKVSGGKGGGNVVVVVGGAGQATADILPALPIIDA